MDLSGKKILVTGATGSLGSEIAVKLSSLGAAVVVTGRNEDKLNAVFSRLSGGGHEKYVADISNIEEIESMINQTAKSGKYSGLVHSAGFAAYKPLRMISRAFLESSMEINFYAFIEIVKLITKKQNFCEQGGSIVAISSFASDSGEMGQVAYSASKAAVDAAVRTLSFELAPKRIRINSIRPGVIKSESLENLRNNSGDENVQKVIGKQLLGIGKPDDVANAAAFLISDYSVFTTGRYIYVDGGRFL